ncbi:MAG: hypothetical protein Q8J68_06905 [Methanolobus sp.]|uniref:hypothetical protein n=1 Tax=Methanolobus sp. TaxID=1874737 RepID=UPI00272FC3E0|nr:hypothetical protein [Methanolobus sp.]MDP2216992.1 hypothetical protein [Methanolobus sp.]
MDKATPNEKLDYLLGTMSKIIDYLLSSVSPIAAVILLFSYSILSSLDALPSFFSPHTFLFSYATVITLFFIGMGRKVDTNIKSIDDEKKVTRELVGHISSLINDIKDDVNDTCDNFESFKKTLTERHKEDAKIYVLNSADELYKKLGEEVTHAKNIRIMHFDSFSPEYYGGEERLKYFNLIFEYLKSNHDVAMKRITSLCEVEKIEWLKRIIKNEEVQNLEKLDIAYIDIPNLEDSVLNTLSTLVSCQVLDGNKTFLLNPLVNFVEASATYHPCLYIESESVAKVYADYFDKIWHEAQAKRGNCRLIKKGKKCMIEELDMIEARLNEKKAQIVNN